MAEGSGYVAHSVVSTDLSTTTYANPTHKTNTGLVQVYFDIRLDVGCWEFICLFVSVDASVEG